MYSKICIIKCVNKFLETHSFRRWHLVPLASNVGYAKHLTSNEQQIVKVMLCDC